MVLPRPSNVGILISSVLVGALGMGSNYFMRHPELLARLSPPTQDLAIDVAKIEEPPVEPPEPADEAEPVPDTPPVEAEGQPEEPKPSPSAEMPLGLAMQELDGLEKNVKSAHANWEKYGVLRREYKRSLTAVAVRALYLKRQVAKQDATEPTKRKARLSALSTAFFAAEMQPEATKPFHILSSEVLRESKTKMDLARTIVLRMLILHDYENPDEQRILAELNKFSDEFDIASDAVFLYQSVARKLDAKGSRAFAIRVLQQGIKRHRKDGSIVNRLINDLIAKKGGIPSA